MQCHLQETFTPWRQLDRLSPSGRNISVHAQQPTPSITAIKLWVGRGQGGGCIQRTRLHSSPCPSLTTRAPSIEFSRTGSPNCHVADDEAPCHRSAQGMSSLGAKACQPSAQGMSALGARHVSPRRQHGKASAQPRATGVSLIAGNCGCGCGRGRRAAVGGGWACRGSVDGGASIAGCAGEDDEREGSEPTTKGASLAG